MNLALCHCSTCGDQSHFEQPPCVDGHGSECPERACVACGRATVVGFDVNVDVAVPVEVLRRAA